MEVQVEFVVTGSGREPEDGERMMDAFMAVYPDGGPAVLQNTKEATITVSLTIEAPSFADATVLAARVCADGLAKAGLKRVDGLELTATVSSVEPAESEAELVLA